MNGWKPTVGAELNDDYAEARKKFFDFVAAMDKLPNEQRSQLIRECMSITGNAAIFQYIANCMYNRGYR